MKNATFEYRALRSQPGVEIVTAHGELHDAFSVMLVVAGLVAYRCNGKEHVRDASVAMLVGPVDVRVDDESSARSDYRVLRVAPGALAEIALHLGLPSSNLVVVEREIASTATVSLFDAFFAALDHDAAPAQMQRLLDACVGEVVRRCATSSADGAEWREVRVARAHMHEHHGAMTVDEIADVAGLGKWGFVALFRHQVGMTVAPAAAVGRRDAPTFASVFARSALVR